jgi:hypothetical protein
LRPGRRHPVAALLVIAALGSVIATPTRADDDDLFGGFEDDFDISDLEPLDRSMPAWLAALPFGELIHERVDLGGSIAVGASYSYLNTVVPHGDEPGRSSSFGNLTRLDVDLRLRLDIALPGDWRIRAEGQGWYDFVYRIKGRGNFGGEVIDVYEWQVDTGEIYLAGPLHPRVDLTVGRKIVNWGRSDTFRVVDVVNPLDNKEPGLVDIEDLRRPRTMVKLDAQAGPWSATLLVIPENRFDRQPPPGSDFFPDLSILPQAFQPFFREAPINQGNGFDRIPGLAAKFDGRFSGWDFSLYGAWVDETDRVLEVGPNGLTREANRFGMAGFAGNFTRGPWLFKAEGAWKTGIRVLRARVDPPFLFSDDKDRIDTMIGVEYFGSDNLAIALEVVNRHLLDFGRGVGNPEQLTEQSVFETNLRITRTFFRERMEVTALGVAFGERFQDGGLARLSADWELTDAWKIEGGILIFIGGPDKGLGAFDSNDRLYAELKYSF